MERDILRTLILCCMWALTSAASVFAEEPDECEAFRVALKRDKVVYIPEGTFTCKHPIVLDEDGMKIIGVGEGKSILKLADHANKPLVILGAIENGKIVRKLLASGLSLDGNYQNQDMECYESPDCTGTGLGEIRNNSLTVRYVEDSNIKNVEVYNARSGGLVIERGSKKINVENLIAHHNFFDGFAACETTESTFTNIEAHHNEYSGLSFDLDFNSNIFKNVRLHNNKDNGIFMRKSSSNRFEDLVIWDNGNNGIYASSRDEEKDTHASHNTFKNVEVKNSKSFGFCIADGHCNKNSIEGVKFSGNKLGNISAEPHSLIVLPERQALLEQRNRLLFASILQQVEEPTTLCP